MSDNDLFVKYNDASSEYAVKNLKAVFYDRGQQRIKFDDTEQYWRTFVERWWHHTDLSFEHVAVTPEQQARLDEVNQQTIEPRHLSEVADYVLFGAVNVETSEPYFATLVNNPEVIDANFAKVLAEKSQVLASHRYQVEVGGATTPNGMTVLTDRESQAQLTSAYQTLKDGLRTSADWKAPTGWVAVTFEDIAPIAQFSATHVQLAFSAERKVSEAMSVLTIEELNDFAVEEEFALELAALWELETPAV